MYCLTSSFSPPARWGLLDFIRAVLLLRLLRLLCLLRLLTRRLLLAVQIPVGTAGPPPRAPDPSGHCRTSTVSCRSQWALPDLNRDFQVAVGTAGPQPRLPDRSGHCRTSTATSRSQWALPDLNRDFQIAVDTAGPQREECQKRCGYGSIPIHTIFRGNEHPFTSYFDVHQGYKVLTHCHVRRYARQNVRRYARKNVRRYARYAR